MQLHKFRQHIILSYAYKKKINKSEKQLPAQMCMKIKTFVKQNLFFIFPSVLVAKNDVVKISDFGTSRTWNEKSTKMSFAGTVAWMAPEVIRNEPCSEKVDIW